MAVQFTVLSIDDDEVKAPTRSVFDKGEISIGRSRLNDLVLDHPGVSNTHARVRIDPNGDGSSKFFISDLDSTNGTMVGNRRLDPRNEVIIPDRDRIMIAGFILKVETVPDELVSSDQPSKGTNGHSKRSSTVHVAFDGGDTSSYIRPEAPVKEEPFSEEIEEQIVTKVDNKGESLVAKHAIEEAGDEVVGEVDRSIPSFSAETKLLVDDGDIEIDFVATALLRLSGVVIHKGSPISGVQVVESNLGERITDDNGSFEFGDIIEGTPYELSFSKDGYLLLPDSSSGNLNDENISLRIEAKRLFAISGKITHKGTPLEGVLIDGGLLGTILTDSSGTYRFENVPEGEEYTLKATKDGYTFGTVRKVA